MDWRAWCSHCGAVVDGGRFDWGQNDKFPTLSAPHYAMDGINFYEEYGPAAFTAKFRAEAMYNFGPCLSYCYIIQGMETLGLRMQRHMENTHKLLEYLDQHEQVAGSPPDLPLILIMHLPRKYFQKGVACHYIWC